MPANYDKIAGIYDVLSRVVYGNNIVNAQVCLLKHVSANSRILIVGGGTGWILEEIAKQHASGLTIDYVENSAQMITLSKKRYCGDNLVHFVNLPIESFTASQLYDVILTPFVLDNFAADKIGLVYKHIDATLKKGGLWLYADFVYNKIEGRWWQKMLLRVMYFFFKVTTKIETDELVPVEGYFAASYKKVFEDAFFFKFIRAVAYQKQ